jgi:uncharacterized protein YdhG (YjbR/CyaY superfamily)
MQANQKMQTIDAYISACPEAIQPKLKELRKIILSAEPGLTERMSWQMPTFFLEGNVIHFAAHKHHIGLYPGTEFIEKFQERLKSYTTSKGAIQIPNEREFDIALIHDIVKFNIERNLHRQ